MFYAIEPQRDIGKIPQELGGSQGLLGEGETQFEKCLDDQAEHFAVYRSTSGEKGSYELVDDFETRDAAQIFVNARRQTVNVIPEGK